MFYRQRSIASALCRFSSFSASASSSNPTSPSSSSSSHSSLCKPSLFSTPPQRRTNLLLGQTYQQWSGVCCITLVEILKCMELWIRSLQVQLMPASVKIQPWLVLACEWKG